MDPTLELVRFDDVGGRARVKHKKIRRRVTVAHVNVLMKIHTRMWKL